MIDVLVVGAGPAGSSLALRLARRGVAVTLLERARFPRTKVCGEYLSSGALLALDSLDMLAAVRARANPIRSILLSAFATEEIELRLPGDGGLALPRADLDAILLDAALAAGANLIHGSYLASAQDDGEGGVAYRDASGEARTIPASVLVGADGAWSAVAQRNGLAGVQRRGGRWAVGGHLRTHSNSDILEMYVGAGGYYARNPLSNRLTNAMLVMPRPIAEDECDAVVARMTAGKHRFESENLERRVAVGPLRYSPRAVARGRVLLTGDAAGLLDPFVGQGVALALELSGAAAEAAHALLSGSDPVQVGRNYARGRHAVSDPRRRLCAAVDALVRMPFLRRRAMRNARRNPDLADPVLAAVVGGAADASQLSLRRLLALIA